MTGLWWNVRTQATLVYAINGMPEGDRVDIRAIDADPTRSGNQAFHLVPTWRGFANHPGEAWLWAEAGQTTLYLDWDGDAHADFMLAIR